LRESRVCGSGEFTQSASRPAARIRRRQRDIRGYTTSNRDTQTPGERR
jgi:hypothetical protein